jgi:hypothetical protein
MKIHHTPNYANERRKEYPAIGDQLDVIAKGMHAIINGHETPEEVKNWLAKIAAVKAAYPKP